MKLYHTSQLEIQVPDVHYGRRNADFGQGFYLTPDKEFAYRWAWENSIINEYELDMTGLNVQSFSRDTDWVNYIFQNRRAKDTLNVDIVVGPIANDTIFDSLGIISSGYLKPEEALKLLLIGPEYTQVALKSERAASCLHWIRAEKISAPKKNRKEQEEYQEMFLKALDNMEDLD